MSGKLDVVVVGNVGVDTNIYLHGHDVDWSVEANFSENIDYVGQAGGYTSRGFAQLGWRTAFIGYVGDDHLGRAVRDALASDGVDMQALFIDPSGTSRSVNIMYRDGRRKNFYDGKGHMRLEPDLARCRAVLERGRLAHVHLPNWARALLPVAKELGLLIACDLQDLVSEHDPYRQDFIAYADIIFFSAANHADPLALAASFAARYPEKVFVMGMAARGCALATGSQLTTFPPVELPAPVVDTNGAGDALAVGFLTSYVLEGRPLHDAVLRGQIAARHTCAQRASSSTLITRKQLDEYARAC